jgi:hypothetical protein
MRPALAFLLLTLAVAASAAPKKIGESAVFNPLMGAMGNLRDSCDKAQGIPEIKTCLVKYMNDGKLDPAAIAFSEKLEEPGFLREFIPKGAVDLGRVEFPWRANFNQTVYFLNGKPPLFDAYGAETLIKFRGPDDSLLFPDGFQLPERIPTFTGIRYAADVSIRKCRACEELGVAKVAWDFTDKGKFVSAKILSTEPPGKDRARVHPHGGALPKQKTQ